MTGARVRKSVAASVSWRPPRHGRGRCAQTSRSTRPADVAGNGIVSAGRRSRGRRERRRLVAAPLGCRIQESTGDRNTREPVGEHMVDHEEQSEPGAVQAVHHDRAPWRPGHVQGTDDLLRAPREDVLSRRQRRYGDLPLGDGRGSTVQLGRPRPCRDTTRRRNASTPRARRANSARTPAVSIDPSGRENGPASKTPTSAIWNGADGSSSQTFALNSPSVSSRSPLLTGTASAAQRRCGRSARRRETTAAPQGARPGHPAAVRRPARRSLRHGEARTLDAAHEGHDLRVVGLPIPLPLRSGSRTPALFRQDRQSWPEPTSDPERSASGTASLSLQGISRPIS